MCIKLITRFHHVTLVAPIPCYVTSKCCYNECNVENHNGDDFEFEIVSGTDMQNRLHEVWANGYQLRYRIIDTTELVDPVDPVLRNRLTRSGIPLWTPWDPVHLVHEAYQEMADIITAPDNSSGDDSESASIFTLGTADASFKRRRPEAVITAPSAPQAKRGKAGWEAKATGWLLGKSDRGHGPGRAGTGPYHP
jgi:hypothetical protein